METITARRLSEITHTLASRDEHLAVVVERFGTPPLWDRPPGFATLVQIILEQQVSLASARACFEKLCGRVGEVGPATLLASSDDELRADGFSRQKALYSRHLAEAVLSGGLDLDGLKKLDDAGVRQSLTKLKGIGPWTADIYLLMALLRPDVMPRGDIALHAAWQQLSSGPRPNADEFLAVAERWRPFRSVAARLLWHFYLNTRRSAPKVR